MNLFFELYYLYIIKMGLINIRSTTFKQTRKPLSCQVGYTLKPKLKFRFPVIVVEWSLDFGGGPLLGAFLMIQRQAELERMVFFM